MSLRELVPCPVEPTFDPLTARFPNLRLVPEQALTFHPDVSFRGPQALWVTAG
jgi:hypothetical protein